MCSAAGASGRPGHPHDVAADRDQEPGAGRDLDLAHGEREALGPAEQPGLLGERVLGLGHADRQVRQPELGDRPQIGLGLGGQVHVTEMVDPNYVVIASVDKKYLPPRKSGKPW
jgi:hypothetical protein